MFSFDLRPNCCLIVASWKFRRLFHSFCICSIEDLTFSEYKGWISCECLCNPLTVKKTLSGPQIGQG